MSELLQQLGGRGELERYCLAGVRVCPVRDGVVLARILGSQLILLDMRDLGITAHLAMEGFWEAWVSLAVARNVRPGWRCVDVGANCGYYTLLLASLVGPAGHVLACEPNPDLACLLRRSVDLNGFGGFVEVAEVAALDGAREVELRIPGSGFVSALNGSVVFPFPGGESHRVAGRALDDLWAAGRVDFIKIDAEGAEALIWDGMNRLCRENPRLAVLMEFCACRYADPEEFVRRLLERGFRLRHVAYDGSLEPVSGAELCYGQRGDWMLWLERGGEAVLTAEARP